ncbi:MAG: hypothetical protein ABL921_04415 [Pirellula sp.]
MEATKNIIEELERLEDLRVRGALDESEFLQAKQILLNSQPAPLETAARFDSHLSAIEREQSLARIDREWEMERRQYFLRTKYGSRKPSVFGGLSAIVVGAGFGAFWLASVAIMVPYPVNIPFVLFGSLVVALAVGSGIKSIVNANSLAKAERDHLKRRNEFLAG